MFCNIVNVKLHAQSNPRIHIFNRRVNEVVFGEEYPTSDDLRNDRSVSGGKRSVLVGGGKVEKDTYIEDVSFEMPLVRSSIWRKLTAIETP